MVNDTPGTIDFAATASVQGALATGHAVQLRRSMRGLDAGRSPAARMAVWLLGGDANPLERT